MTSLKRKEKRYLRRKQKREKKQFTYDDILNPNDYFEAFKKCKKGVDWKTKTINYEVNLIHNVNDLLKDLKEKKDIRKPFYNFKINERGKTREIQALDFSERIPQKVLCDKVLIPTLTKTLIYDNGASQKGKGVSFARKRFKKHLVKYINKNGSKGYIILIDYSKYFENIDQEILKEKIIDKYFKDEDLNNYIYQYVKAFKKGLGLGSQVAQVLAVAYVNEIDQYAKTKLRLKYYGRYMDDSYIIIESLEEAKDILNKLNEACLKLNIKINFKKTKIIPLKQPFIYLQRKYFINNKNIVIKANKKSIVRERRKLKRLYNYSKLHNLNTRELLEASFNSWKGSLIGTKCYNQLSTLKVKIRSI